MVLRYDKFEWHGHRTFERMVAHPPMRVPVSMPEEACFYYLVRGRGRTYAPHQVIDHAAQEGLALHCGNYFTECLPTGGNDSFEVIAVHLPPPVLEWVYGPDLGEWLTETDRVEPATYLRYPAEVLLRKYMDGLRFYFENPELVSEELQRLKFRELFLLLARTDEVGPLRSLLQRLFAPTDVDFRTVVETHLFEHLSLAELAHLAGRSLSSFKRDFARLFGEPPAAYLRRRRLERAAELLRATTDQVAHVAYDCGFRSQAHFARLFRATYGQSPTAYRRARG